MLLRSRWLLLNVLLHTAAGPCRLQRCLGHCCLERLLAWRC